MRKTDRIRAEVNNALNCNGCTACCRDQLVVIVEEDGDPAQWDTVPMEIDQGAAMLTAAGFDEDIRCLRTKDDGSCIYLGEHGCTIYERRPAMCRAFDCRMLVRETLRGRLTMPISHPVMAAGLQRLGTLDE